MDKLNDTVKILDKAIKRLEKINANIINNGKSLMRFTGMQDVNNKDIYDGDILRVHKFIEVLGENYGVSEGELEFIAEVQCHDIGVYLATNKIAYDDVTYSDYVVCMSGLHEESFEIIGNIYENKDLLNQLKT